MSGKRYGRLIAVTRHDVAKWLFNCDCGKSKAINGKNVRRGLVVSCGCVQRSIMSEIGKGNKTHGQSQETAEYRAWHHAKERCRNENHIQYEYYGGRGIEFCAEWNSFEAFFAHVGPRPSTKHSLDRYPDNDGNYEPGNVRWANAKQQANNRRKRRTLSEPAYA